MRSNLVRLLKSSKWPLFAVPVCALGAYAALRIGARPLGSAAVTSIGLQTNGTYLVPTGQTIHSAGQNTTFDGRPVDMALRPDGKTLAVMAVNAVRLFDLGSGKFLPDVLRGAHSFGGLVWSSDGSMLYSTGSEPTSGSGGETAGAVYVTRYDADGHPTAQKPILFAFQSEIKPNRRATDAKPSGLALSPDGHTLYVSLFNNGAVSAVDLRSYDPATGSCKMTSTPVGSSPEKIIVSPGGDRVYVADRGGNPPKDGDTMDTEDPVVVDPHTYKALGGSVTELDASALQANTGRSVLRTIPVGLQPAALAQSNDGRLLYVANANDDSVTVADTSSGAVLERIAVSPAPGKLAASSPNGLALSRDGSTLYVALGGDNAIEVLRLSRGAGGNARRTQIAGLIPTAWFPLGVILSPDGANLYVANSKGVGSLGEKVLRNRAPSAATPEAGPGGVTERGTIAAHSVYAVLGSVGRIPVPDAKTLAEYTRRSAEDDHFDRMSEALQGRADPLWQRFRHVILIVKENRTYDQVFGDVAVPAGHVGGEPGLVMFGANVSPNHHALAKEFGLFDNFYCSGTISADGHHWLNEAFADDYDERAMNSYPRSYPCCGTDPLSFAGNKFLWQAAMDAGKTFHNYGEFGPLPSIKSHSDLGFDDKFEVSATRNRDVAHSDRIIADLDGTKGAGLADLTMVWFSNDHTSGTRPGSYTPEACVADNDRALGLLVDAVSHSKKYWHDEPTAIFVVEDDAQGGLDHVDGHRTVALAISPFNRRGQVVSTNFNQLSMIRTIELILGLRPLNQFDAAAVSMRSCFQDKGDFRPFDALNNQIALNMKNPPANSLFGTARHWAEVCNHLDFSAPDRSDPELLTEDLWHHTYGDAEYPPTTAAIR